VALHKAIHEDEEIVTWNHVKYALKQIKDNKMSLRGCLPKSNIFA